MVARPVDEVFVIPLRPDVCRCRLVNIGDGRDVPVEVLSDEELFAIIRGERPLTLVYDPSGVVDLKGG